MIVRDNLSVGDSSFATNLEPNSSFSGNPHRHPERCNSCHENDGETLIPVLRDQIDSQCLSCHDGNQAKVGAHPVGRFIPDNDRFTLPQGWPLNDGKLGCLTCHDVRLTCDKTDQAYGNKNFLRDKWLGNKQGFCQNCHNKNGYGRFVPHIMLTGSNDILNLSGKQDVDEATCLFCHVEVPDRNALKRTGNPRLRASQKVLCQICHRMHQKFYSPGHMGAKIPNRMLAYIFAREMLGSDNVIKNEYLTRLEEARATPVHMVPDSNGRITCSTCHNPHQENVFSEYSEMNYDLMWLIGPGKVKSLSTSKTICSKCHF